MGTKGRRRGTDMDRIGATRRIPELLEEDMIRQLQAGDLPGARRTAAVLIDRALENVDDESLASYVLYDILGAIERVISSNRGLPRHGIVGRSNVIRCLAASSSRENLLSAFWVAFEQLTAPLRAIQPDGHPAVEQVKAFVKRNYSRKLSLAEIAREVKVSRNYLSHLFRQHCGLTVTEFVHRTRLGEAERLLASGRRSVSEIAYLVGYQNYRDFHRNFVKLVKTSPKRFRQARSLSREDKTVAMT